MQDDTRRKHVHAICDHAKEKGFDVMLFNAFGSLDYMNSFLEGEMNIIDRIPMQELSVLVIFTESFLNTEVTDDLARRAKEAELPVISIDHKMENCHNILFAYEESFEMIVRHIVEHHGCKRINFMAGFENNDFSDARINIFKKVLKENNLTFEQERLGYGQFWEMPARNNCERWIKMWEQGEQERPDAIICANDIMALTVLNVLNNHGIRVPQDVLLTGFDGLELEKYCTPRLTNACDDVELLGTEIMKMVENTIKTAGREPYDVKIPFQTKFSESCGCMPTEPCNPNEQIMFLYGRLAERRIQSTDTFMMMNVLTDGYSAIDMAKKLKQYQKMIAVDSMMIFLNRVFYSVTDIPTDDFDTESMLLLAKVKDGKYTVPMREIKQSREYKELRAMLNNNKELLFVPLHWQEEVYGYMVASYEDCDKDLGAFYEFVLGFEQALGTIRKQSLLHNMYITDMLTELYNRRGFYNLLEQKIQNLSKREKVAFLASVDMDGLKFINDNYGHAEGDYAIKVVACLLKDSLGGHSGICARFGGDEYMVVIVEEAKEADVEFYKDYERLLQEQVQQFAKKNNKPYEIGVSVGTVFDKIKSLDDIDALMKKADDIMYQCKSEHHASRASRVRRGKRS